MAVRPARPGTDARRLLAPAVLAAVGAGVVAVAVAAVVTGGSGAVGALVGLGLVLSFLLLGQVPVAQAAKGRRSLGAGLLLLLYLIRVALLLTAFRLVVAGDDVHRRAVGVTVIACALSWTAGTVWSALRWRPLVVEPADAEGSAPRR
jgi:ATP synthase protein I